MPPHTLIAHRSPGPRRHWLALALLAVILIGLATRKYPLMLPAALGKYPGDALWAIAVWLGFALIKPAESLARLAIAALGFSWLVELSQLYQAPWINAIRHTTIGHLFLGTTFGWMDMLAYAVGIALVLLVIATVTLLRRRR